MLIRLGRALDGVELRDGFPKAVDELYRYHAIVIDDLEAAFFSPDQLALLRNFVSVRGGGLLMLGGPDSFAEGKYDRTPVGELLPVYLNRAPTEPADAGEYRLVLTREGWLQPWVRLRKTEDEENKRLAAMVPFETLSRVANIKPGAVVLAEVSDGSETRFPALVAQQFGRGHAAALLIGGLWRWQLARKNLNETDFDRAGAKLYAGLLATCPTALKPRCVRSPAQARRRWKSRSGCEMPSTAPSTTAKSRCALFVRQATNFALMPDPTRASRAATRRLTHPSNPASIDSSRRQQLPTGARSASGKPAGLLNLQRMNSPGLIRTRHS